MLQKEKGYFSLKNSSTKNRVDLGEKFVSDDVIMRRFGVLFIGSVLTTRGSVLSVNTKRNWCSIRQHAEYLRKATDWMIWDSNPRRGTRLFNFFPPKKSRPAMGHTQHPPDGKSAGA